MAIEDVVTQDQAARLTGNEVSADQERVRQAAGRRLLDIAEPQSPLAAVTQERPEGRQRLGRADHQDLPDPRQHQRRQGIIHHRLIVDREKLLADPDR